MKYFHVLIKVYFLITNILVGDMRKMIKDMLDEVEVIDKSNSVCEELYGKLE